MKPYNYLLLSILLYPLFTSCVKEEGESAPVSLIPHIAGVSLTRAGINDAKDIPSIGFYAVSKESSDGTYGVWPAGTYGKFKGETTGGSTTFTPSTPSDILWLVPDKDATIFCCYPADNSSTIVDASKLNADGTVNGSPTTPSAPVPTIPVPATIINLSPALPTDGNTDFTLPANDYMYGVTYTASAETDESKKYGTTQPTANGNRTGGVVNTSGPTVAIGLKHAFSQIKLIIKKGESYPGTATVSEVKYTRAMRTLTANAKMKLTDGTFLGATSATSNSYTYNLKAAANSNQGMPLADTNSEITLISYALPCAKAGSIIRLTADGKEMTIKYAEDVAWEAGKIYTYSVKINGTGLSFSGVSIVGWNDSNDNNSSGTL